MSDTAQDALHRLEGELIQLSSILGWIEEVLDCGTTSDFGLSFPLVRRVFDLRGERDISRQELANCRHEANERLEEENKALKAALETQEPMIKHLWPMLTVWGEEAQKRKMRIRELEIQLAAVNQEEVE